MLLMDVGEGVGVQLFFGCWMGICQLCVVDLVEGYVWDLCMGQWYEFGIWVQICVLVVLGDCVLDIQCYLQVIYGIVSYDSVGYWLYDVGRR